MKKILNILFLTLIFSSFAYSQNNQRFIPFYNTMVDEFNYRNEFIAGVRGEIRDADGYIASNSRRFVITSSTYSKDSVDSDYRSIRWEYEKQVPTGLSPAFQANLKEYEAAKYRCLESRAKLRDYFAQNSQNIGKYRTIPKFTPALTKILVGAKPYVRSLETELNKFIAVKSSLLAEGRAIADNIEAQALKNAPNGEYFLALKKHLAMYRELLQWIDQKKGKVVLAEYKIKIKALKDYAKTLAAMPKLKNDSLQYRYKSYVDSVEYSTPLLDEVVDRWEMWGYRVHPSHYEDMGKAYENLISNYNSFVDADNKGR